MEINGGVLILMGILISEGVQVKGSEARLRLLPLSPGIWPRSFRVSAGLVFQAKAIIK
jgi:hypothetical protein